MEDKICESEKNITHKQKKLSNNTEIYTLEMLYIKHIRHQQKSKKQFESEFIRNFMLHRKLGLKEDMHRKRILRLSSYWERLAFIRFCDNRRPVIQHHSCIKATVFRRSVKIREQYKGLTDPCHSARCTVPNEPATGIKGILVLTPANEKTQETKIK